MAEDKKDAVAVRVKATEFRPMPPRAFSLMPSTLGEAMEIGKLIASSDFAPKDYKGKPGNVVIAMQMGADIGLKPMQALQNIAVINGRPSIYGDAALALVYGADLVEDFSESYEGEEGKDSFAAVCVLKRKNVPTPIRRTFSVADAKAAGLWGKAGPWTNYWKRMLMWRARGFTLRDGAPDVLLGLILVEEAMDLPVVTDIGAVESSAVDLLPRVSDGLRENIEKAFEALALAPGLRLAKVTEFLGGNPDPEEGAEALLHWCRDEYAKRKTGMPAKPKGDSNGKPKRQDPPAGDPAGRNAGHPAPRVAGGEPAAPADTVAPGPAADSGDVSVPPAQAPLTAAEVGFDF